jgi:hypothetical protein
VRDGSFFPGLLEPRKRAERALVATVAATVHVPTGRLPAWRLGSDVEPLRRREVEVLINFDGA